MEDFDVPPNKLAESADRVVDRAFDEARRRGRPTELAQDYTEKSLLQSLQHLSLADGCPSRGRRYEPLRRQSQFEGSFRQRRAETLRLVAAGRSKGLDAEAVASLEQDGLVEIRAGLARLPQ